LMHSESVPNLDELCIAEGATVARGHRTVRYTFPDGGSISALLKCMNPGAPNCGWACWQDREFDAESNHALEDSRACGSRTCST
jgi:hypothetical protein